MDNWFGLIDLRHLGMQVRTMDVPRGMNCMVD
jgi:hypothetical protein